MKKILVVDDDKPFRGIVATTLRREGYDVLEAGAGAAGLALASVHRPDLILSDVHMGGMDGLELLEKVRARPETSAIPVVLMTGQPLTTGPRTSMNLGADDYLQKPFTPEELLAAVQARLHRQEGIQLAAEAEHAGAAEKMSLLNSALEAAANGIAITDRNGKILWINHAFTRLTGYTAAEAVGQNSRVLKSGDHPPEFYANLWSTIAAGNVWQGDLLNKRKNGSTYFEEMTITPVRGVNGDIQNFIAIKQDVSERKKIEEALAHKRDLLQTLMDSLPDHIYFKDADSRFTHINLALARHLGLPNPEAAIGKADADFFSPHEARQKLVEERHLLATGEPILGLIEKSDTGNATQWVSSTKVPIRAADGKITGLVGISRDVTESKRVEETLQRQQAELRVLFDLMPALIWFKDTENRILRVNQRVAELAGKSVAEIEGRPSCEIYPQEAARFYADDLEVIRSGAPKLAYVETVPGPAGQELWVQTDKVPYCDKNGKVIGIVVMAQDITERKRVNDALEERAGLAALEAAVGTALTRSGTLAEMLRRCSEAIVRHLDAAFVRIWSLNEREQMLELLASAGLYTHLTGPHGRVPVGKFKIGLIAEERKPHLTNQVLGDPRVSNQEWAKREGMVAFAGYPLLVEDRLVGVVAMFARHTLTDTALQALASISKNIAAGMERKRMEESLHESEEKYRGLFENSRDAILTVDPATGRFIAGNPAALKMFRAKNEQEFLTFGPGDLSPEWQPDGSVSAEKARQIDDTVRRDGSHFFEWTHRRINGEGFSADVLLTRVERGGKPVILSTVRDITERKRTDEALRESHRFLQSTLDALSSHIAILADHGTIIEVNAAWNRFARENGFVGNYGVGDNYLQVCRSAEGACSEEASPVAMGIRSVMDGTRKEFYLEYPCHSPQEQRWFIVRATRFAGAGPVRVVVAHENITERKRLESQLFQAQKLESVGQLAAGIAHEINTPTQYVGDNTRFVKDSFAAILKVLKGHEELLAAAKQNALTPELLVRHEAVLAASDLEYLCEQIPLALTETLEGVGRVSKIVQAMKEFSHPGGKEKTLADLNKAVESTVTVARNEWKYVAELKLELEPNLPLVPCFLGEFNQCILNLIVNAAHTIADVVKQNPGTKGLITVQTRRAGDQVAVRVTDTGTGIPEVSRPKIFAPFFTTKEVGKGTGQGLSIIYGSIVKRHGGTVTFETEVGRGTTFIIRLPINSKPAPETQAA